ncbi:hypothetical protein AAFF_G00345820 [Aldrovandia affinis]|uniref:Uncharacterized protein n=1 Tax=Aldrovandia affinis TaxID=143900 RepID=A0AAD7SJD4_9TELE|nr:hypothetical protein AAFF_G00345820 [Aldrovandia affinis]
MLPGDLSSPSPRLASAEKRGLLGPRLRPLPSTGPSSKRAPPSRLNQIQRALFCIVGELNCIVGETRSSPPAPVLPAQHPRPSRPLMPSWLPTARGDTSITRRFPTRQRCDFNTAASLRRGKDGAKMPASAGRTSREG